MKYRVVMVIQIVYVILCLVLSYISFKHFSTRVVILTNIGLFSIPFTFFFKFNDTRKPRLSKMWISSYLRVLATIILIPTISICLLIGHFFDAKYTFLFAIICAISGFVFGKLGYRKFQRDFDKELDKEEANRKWWANE